jgi:hypothetical protein
VIPAKRIPQVSTSNHTPVKEQHHSEQLSSASQGERLARLRTELAFRNQARDQQAVLELEARFEAERGGARASFAAVQEGTWWDVATPRQIADVYESAIVWRDYDEQRGLRSRRSAPKCWTATTLT